MANSFWQQVTKGEARRTSRLNLAHLQEGSVRSAIDRKGLRRKGLKKLLKGEKGKEGADLSNIGPK